MEDYDVLNTCERCEEYYSKDSNWDDDCYCEDCCYAVYPEYWKLVKENHG